MHYQFTDQETEGQPSAPDCGRGHTIPRVELGLQIPSSVCMSLFHTVSESKSEGKGTELQTSQVSLAQSKDLS